MISDNDLQGLIAYFEPIPDYAGAPSEVFTAKVLAAITELAHYRRTFAKMGKIARTEGEITLSDFGGVRFWVGVKGRNSPSDDIFGDTPFAALSALADSIIREELERKGEG